MKYIVLICFLLVSSVAMACLNEEHVTKSGKKSVDGFTLEALRLFKSQDIANLELALKNLLSKKNETEEDQFSTENSIAVTYIKLGKLKEAEEILLQLLKKRPNNYSVTINLGTLYELQGKNTEALNFIKKAVLIDPGSHGGSEWFHIKILEYKLKNIPDDKIEGQNVLDLYHIKKPAADIAYDVSYQLQERIPFSPAPNILIAKVMQELGDYLADSVSIKAAYVVYEIGMDYDRANLLNFPEKRDSLKPYFKKYRETIPVTGVYYLDKLIPADDGEKVNIALTVLEKGFSYFTEQEEKRKQAARQKQYFIWGGVGLAVLVTGLIFYKKRKQAV